MKTQNICGVIVFVVAMLTAQIVEAQGTQYLSNLGYTSNGGSSIGSNSSFAANFFTGTNAGGYELNSVQLAMTDASGTPSGLTVMIYPDVGGPSAVPGSSIGSLSGSASPTTAGLYTYTAPSNLLLLPQTGYFIVLTAGTAVANGAYEWSFTSTPSFGFNPYFPNKLHKQELETYNKAA